MLGTNLLVILILLLIGTLPTYPYSRTGPREGSDPFEKLLPIKGLRAAGVRL